MAGHRPWSCERVPDAPSFSPSPEAAPGVAGRELPGAALTAHPQSPAPRAAYICMAPPRRAYWPQRREAGPEWLRGRGAAGAGRGEPAGMPPPRRDRSGSGWRSTSADSRAARGAAAAARAH